MERNKSRPENCIGISFIEKFRWTPSLLYHQLTRKCMGDGVIRKPEPSSSRRLTTSWPNRIRTPESAKSRTSKRLQYSVWPCRLHSNTTWPHYQFESIPSFVCRECHWCSNENPCEPLMSMAQSRLGYHAYARDPKVGKRHVTQPGNSAIGSWIGWNKSPWWCLFDAEKMQWCLFCFWKVWALADGQTL